MTDQAPKRKKRSRDANLLARAIVDEATGTSESKAKAAKDPAAVSLGRRGGLVGGKARAQKLTPEERKHIASLAAQSRWKSK